MAELAKGGRLTGAATSAAAMRPFNASTGTVSVLDTGRAVPMMRLSASWRSRAWITYLDD
jgi:hypothetical protein